MLYGHLMYINTRLVISSTERQHAIISDIHKGLQHDSKTAKAMALYYGKGFKNTKDLKQIFLAQDQKRCRRVDSEMQATSEAEKNEKVCPVNFIASPLKLM